MINAANGVNYLIASHGLTHGMRYKDRHDTISDTGIRNRLGDPWPVIFTNSVL